MSSQFAIMAMGDHPLLILSIHGEDSMLAHSHTFSQASYSHTLIYLACVRAALSLSLDCHHLAQEELRLPFYSGHEYILSSPAASHGWCLMSPADSPDFFLCASDDTQAVVAMLAVSNNQGDHADHDRRSALSTIFLHLKGHDSLPLHPLHL